LLHVLRNDSGTRDLLSDNADSGGTSLDDGCQLSASHPVSGLSLDDRHQLSTSQPISGLSLDDGYQLSASQPISGLSLDGSRQFNASQPPSGDVGGRSLGGDIRLSSAQPMSGGGGTPPRATGAIGVRTCQENDEDDIEDERRTGGRAPHATAATAVAATTDSTADSVATSHWSVDTSSAPLVQSAAEAVAALAAELEVLVHTVGFELPAARRDADETLTRNANPKP
jgi:hypothetical protein